MFLSIYLFNLLLLGTPANPSPSGIPLPDRRTLELILDKLQKYGFWFPISLFFFCFGIYGDMNDCIVVDGGACFWVLFCFDLHCCGTE